MRCPACEQEKPYLLAETGKCFECSVEDLKQRVVKTCKQCGRGALKLKRGMCYTCYGKWYRRKSCYDDFVIRVSFFTHRELWNWLHEEAAKRDTKPQQIILEALRKYYKEVSND